MIVLDAKRASDWLRQRIAKPTIVAWMGPWVALGYERDGQMIGAVVFDAFTETECAMHVAISAPIPRSVVREVFKYPFVTAKLQRITATVAPSNTASIRLILRWGFKFEGRKRVALGDEDELIYGLLKQECRFHA
jgi:RimJ/RimL family protein N-acetyltransferase